jgi:arylsulfatase A-like enzyme
MHYVMSRPRNRSRGVQVKTGQEQMWKRLVVGLVVVLLGIGVLALLNREAIIFYMVQRAVKVDVAENRPIEWLSGPPATASDRSNGPPNIIVIMADDLGINDISTFGGGVAGGAVPTPNIDRLAASGAVFTQAYSGTATCAPSRAMVMTGRYPTRTGFEFTPTPPGMPRIVGMFSKDAQEGSGLPKGTANPSPPPDSQVVEFSDMGLPPSEVTVAQLLGEAGYHNIHIGKWHLGVSEKFRPVAQGFDESLLMSSGLYLPEDHPDVVNAKLDFDPIDRFFWGIFQYAAEFNRAGEAYVPDRFEPGGYLTDYWTDEALKVIDANRDRPFYLQLDHWGPHTPLQATREDYEAVGDIRPHRLRVYAAMIRALDRSVGRILDKLEQEGLAENTIVIFASDNGGAGYLGLPEVNAPYRGWKITLFEGGIRIPLFVSWPGKIAPGTRISTPVAHIDLLPTLAAMAGAPLPDGVTIDGQNILPEMLGTGRIKRPDDALYWSSGFYRVVRAGDWKLQYNGRQDRTWLFNLANDPTEQVNLAETHPEERARLEALMEAHWAKARAPLYAHQTEGPICIDNSIVDRPCRNNEYVIWPN